MLELVLGAVATVFTLFMTYRQGKKNGEATVTVENFEEVAKRVKESRNITRSLTPGTKHFDELRQRYARK